LSTAMFPNRLSAHVLVGESVDYFVGTGSRWEPRAFRSTTMACW
jgi:hypothetical protein